MPLSYAIVMDDSLLDTVRRLTMAAAYKAESAEAAGIRKRANAAKAAE
jgi:hypothetical protein